LDGPCGSESGDSNTTPPLTEQSADIRDSSDDPNATCYDDPSVRVDPKPDPKNYYQWLSTELKLVHDAVKINHEKVKLDDKVKYDRAHKAVELTWKVGDKVLLQETTVKPGTSKIITKQRFVGPYVIKHIVGHPDVRQAYRLMDEVTGKELRHLVWNNRLKRYNVNLEQFNTRLPSLQTGAGALTQRSQTLQTVVGQRQAGPEEPRPVEIMSVKRVAGKNQYRVKYTDGKVYNCDWVNRPLLDH